MIKRIVKLSFEPEKVNDFKKIYEHNWPLIKGFNGCKHVELLQVNAQENIFFTFSIWQSEEHLNIYRRSALFESVWAGTKVLFNDKPQAWTVNEITF